MESLDDSIIFGETPHANDRFKPLTYGASQLLKYLRRIVKHLPHHFLESLPPFCPRFAAKRTRLDSCGSSHITCNELIIAIMHRRDVKTISLSGLNEWLLYDRLSTLFRYQFRLMGGHVTSQRGVYQSCPLM